MRMVKPSLFFCLVSVCCCAAIAAAQTQANPGQHSVAHVADGGMSETLQSIVIPSIAHAPFYATLDTEWARPLVGGGSYTFQNERHIARDSAGRVYEERWYLVPKNGKDESKMYYIQILDPVKHEAYWCPVAKKACGIRPYYPAEEVEFGAVTNAQGVLPDGGGFVTHEDLGKQNLAGVDATGTRETITVNPWMAGNDRPMIIVREYWHSAALNLNLLSTLTDPRLGTQSFTITEISTSEPDAALFLPPAGYKIVDQRGSAEAAH